MASLKFAIASDTGRIRKNNQDSGYASPNMLLVADGMGGAAAGDLASAVAVTELKEADKRVSGEEMLALLADHLITANQNISELVRADPSLDGMGTTVCGALFDGEQIGLVHIGDSRGYLLRDETLRRLTHDHSWVQSLIDEGRLTPEQAEVHPHRSLILKVLNGQPEHQPDFDLVDVQLGDRLLFCSDGLTGMISEETLAELMAGEDLDEAVASLVDAANAAGGQDNITVALGVLVEDDPTLESVPPVMVGAAATIDIPTPAEVTTMMAAIVDDEPEIDEETVRYTPESTKRRFRGPIIVTVLIAAMITLAGWAGFSYAKTKVFVGVDGEQVAIYHGVPGQLLGFRIQELYSQDATLVSDLPVYYQERVRQGIAVADLDAAEATVHELQLKAARCIEIRATQPSVSPSPSASASPSASSSPSGSKNPSTKPSKSASASASASNSPYPNTPDTEGC